MRGRTAAHQHTNLVDLSQHTKRVEVTITERILVLESEHVRDEPCYTHNPAFDKIVRLDGSMVQRMSNCFVSVDREQRDDEGVTEGEDEKNA